MPRVPNSATCKSFLHGGNAKCNPSQLFLDNPLCTKEGTQEKVHPERSGSSFGDRFANLIGNSRSESALDVVFLSPEHEDYPTIDMPYEDRGSAVAAMRVPWNRSGSGCVRCMLELRQSNRQGRVLVTEQAWKQSVRTARLDLASMAKVVIAAVENRFPEGGSRQRYSDVQWLNSSWWGLELGQTYQEKQEAVGMRGTQHLYAMD
jgi:hypothetical protein